MGCVERFLGGRTRALVTAIGGDLGQGVARALARHGVEIVACDSESLHEWVTSGMVGLGVDKFARVPLAADPTYRNTLLMLADAWQADLIAPCSEQEIAACWSFGDTQDWDDFRILGLTPGELVHCLFDKWETAKLAREHGLPFAETWDWGEDDETGVVVKPRQKHADVCTWVTQERLEGPEYTVAVWRGHETRALALRRELRGGATYRAWYEPDTAETCHAERVGRDYAEALGLRGSFNVQGRYVAGRGFIPFEVNPRFSSTVSMRDSMGFCDAWWSVQEALGLPVSEYKRPARSRALRYWAEAAQVGGEWK